MVVHGGSGSPRRGADGELGRRQGLRAALEVGRALLLEGGTALDAVEQAVRRLESHPLFNAGRGSVLTSAGAVEMDASLMNGADRAAGAVCSVSRLEHPISAARLVMERSPHVLLSAEAAEAFALAEGAESVDPASLITPERREQLERARGKVGLDHDDEDEDEDDDDRGAATEGADRSEGPAEDVEYGTVGAVARDARGHLAAATSTGGLVGKLPGRVGDTPIPGAGTWADDATCAVSLTGHGESILRAAVAHEVDAQVRLRGVPLEKAASDALRRAKKLGGRGGLIAIDRQGRMATPFTTRALYRGWVEAEGEPVVKIFADE